MARMKGKNELVERDIQKMIKEYWETLQLEQKHILGKNSAVTKIAHLNVSQ